MSKNIIFYFSGTGNSFKAARDIAAVLDDVKLAPIPEHFGANLSGYDRIGFVYPIYFGSVPLVVKNFVDSLELPENVYLFAVATYGGNILNGLTELNTLLSAKGHELDYGASVKMGANYILMYGKMPESDVVNQQADKILPKLAEEIHNKEKQPCELSVPLHLPPFMEQARQNVHEAAAEYVVNDDCISCGLCRDICPVRNIELKEGKPTFGNKCEQCMACIQWCPTEALNSGEKTKGRERYRNPSVTAADLQRN